MRRLVLLIALLISGCSSADVLQATSSDATQTVRVVKVIDGDTVKVRVDGRRESVRFIGIDTPETYAGPECGGEQATAALRKRIRRGDRVRLVYDTTQDHRDRYDRLLAYVELPNGTDLGRMQVRAGWARVYVYDRPFRRLASYEAAARRAEAEELGVHRVCQ